MRRALSILVICIALAALGCSPTPVKLDYDPAIDFDLYRTYDWLDNRPDMPAVVKSSMTRFPAVDAPLRAAVSEGLAAKRLALDEVDPNVLVAYHVGAENDIDVVKWGYRYANAKAGWGVGLDVVSYPKGTLVIDVIDAKTMYVIWRASARRAIDGDPSQSTAGERIAGAVEEMLRAYPAR